MKIIAHRTGMADAPENSMEGLRKCFHAGADGAECDITLADNTPFVWADDMNRLLKKPVSSITNFQPNAIRNFQRTDSPEPIAEMRDIWNFMSTHQNFTIYFDVKYYSRRARLLSWPIDVEDLAGHFLNIPARMIDRVLETIVEPSPTKSGIGFVTFQGGAELLRAIKRAYPEVHTNLIVIFPWSGISRHLAYCDSITIGWKRYNHWKLFPKSLANVAREAKTAGVLLHAGITNTAEEMLWVMGQKEEYDGIWTDHVSLARSLAR